MQAAAPNPGRAGRIRDPAPLDRTQAAHPRRALRPCRHTGRDRFYDNEIRRSEPAPARPTGRPPSTVWVTRPILKTRGWTDAAIREFLPRPERHYANPHVQGRSPMPIWSARTVGRIEATDEWRLWLAQSLARRNTTLRELAESIREHAFRHRAKAADSAIAYYRDSRIKANR